MNQVRKTPRYAKIDGILHPAAFSPKCFREALNYQPKQGDVFIATYPKCGTTWMQNVALYIFQKGKELEDMSLFNAYCPFIDMYGYEGIEKMPRPGAIKTHIPFTRKTFSPDAKYIFVARNPKDCCVSFYHHTRSPAFDFEDGTFSDFFEAFMNGEVEYNDYFDHLLSWHTYRNHPNVFYTTYEHMKEDIRDVIHKLATFLGKEYIEAIENDNAVLRNIMHYTSFNYMKENINNVFNRPFRFIKEIQDPSTYEGAKYFAHCLLNNLSNTELKWEIIRKGIVGDWKNIFSAKQEQRLDQKFLERMTGMDIPNWFKNI